MAASSDNNRELNMLIDNAEDQELLRKENLHLCLAMGVVANGGQVNLSTVWQTFAIGGWLSLNLMWRPDFAFNWTSSAPAHGVPIRVSGTWTTCEIGQALNLDATGKFVPQTGGGTPGQLTIGKNEFILPNDGQVYIVIGISFGQPLESKPIFIDNNQLLPNMSATYQPTEQVQWWYDSTAQEGTVYTSGLKSPADGAVFSEPNFLKTRKWVAMYHPKKGTWDKAAVGPQS